MTTIIWTLLVSILSFLVGLARFKDGMMGQALALGFIGCTGIGALIIDFIRAEVIEDDKEKGA